MAEIILGVAIALTLGIIGVEFYYFKKKFEKIENELKKVRAVLNKISFDLTMDKILEKSSSEGMRKKLMVIGEKILEYLKRKYDIKDATTYMEMKKRIEKMDEIPKEEKEQIIEFLENMIYVQYSSKTISPRRKEKIKRILMGMLRKMGALQ